MAGRAIYHLVPLAFYQAQATDEPYYPAAFVEEGFIHCTAGLDMLLTVANNYFAALSDRDRLLVLEIDPTRLSSPLKFEAATPPTTGRCACPTSGAVISTYLWPA
jgi:uncharacterized protein (DUF952 family)